VVPQECLWNQSEKRQVPPSESLRGARRVFSKELLGLKIGSSDYKIGKKESVRKSKF